jgi:hypothetical protein
MKDRIIRIDGGILELSVSLPISGLVEILPGSRKFFDDEFLSPGKEDDLSVLQALLKVRIPRPVYPKG